jgi:cytochrome P450
MALQQASIFVATVMRHFTLELARGHAVWPMHWVTLRLSRGLPMIVRR